MADTINVTSVDILNVRGTASYFVPDGSSTTLANDLEILIQDFGAPSPELVEMTTTTFSDDTPSPVGGTTPFCYQAARVEFLTSDLLPYVCYVLGPKDGSFDGSGHLDTGQAWVHDFIQWMLDNATDERGIGLGSYVSGTLVALEPGWLDVNGAAQQARRGGLVGEFYAQDGADVKAG